MLETSARFVIAEEPSMERRRHSRIRVNIIAAAGKVSPQIIIAAATTTAIAAAAARAALPHQRRRRSRSSRRHRSRLQN